MKGKILTMALAGSLLYLCSCSDASKYDALVQPQPGEEQEQLSDEVEVTFTIATEESVQLSRAGGPGASQTLSKGQYIDMLVYGIYELGDDGHTYNLLRQYNRGVAEELENAAALKVGNGQHEGLTVAYVGEAFKNGGTYSITLRLMRNKEYYMAYWAQNSTTEAYDTNVLREVKVNYEGKNNDEYRDAFCKVDHFSVRAGENRTVILTRPFAQINVGTTGADYKNHAMKTAGGHTYKYSSISLTGVSNTINVVTDEIGAASNVAVELQLATIPAYYKFKPEEIPSTDDGLIANNSNPKEELLLVDIDGDGKFSDYKDTYPTIDISDKGDTTFITESFKYLSMCYVLVPATKVQVNPSDSIMHGPVYNSTLLSNVAVLFADGLDMDSDDTHTSGFAIQNVPVHRNWRTNILGGLHKGTESDDKPVTPEDPSSLFKPFQVTVSMQPKFDNEWDNWDQTGNGDDKWTQNGNLPASSNTENK